MGGSVLITLSILIVLITLTVYWLGDFKKMLVSTWIYLSLALR